MSSIPQNYDDFQYVNNFQLELLSIIVSLRSTIIDRNSISIDDEVVTLMQLLIQADETIPSFERSQIVSKIYGMMDHEQIVAQVNELMSATDEGIKGSQTRPNSATCDPNESEIIIQFISDLDLDVLSAETILVAADKYACSPRKKRSKPDNGTRSAANNLFFSLDILDDLSDYESLQVPLEMLQRNHGSVEALEKVLSFDAADLQEHCQWEELREALLTALIHPLALVKSTVSTTLLSELESVDYNKSRYLALLAHLRLLKLLGSYQQAEVASNILHYLQLVWEKTSDEKFLDIISRSGHQFSKLTLTQLTCYGCLWRILPQIETDSSQKEAASIAFKIFQLLARGFITLTAETAQEYNICSSFNVPQISVSVLQASASLCSEYRESIVSYLRQSRLPLASLSHARHSGLLANLLGIIYADLLNPTGDSDPSTAYLFAADLWLSLLLPYAAVPQVLISCSGDLRPQEACIPIQLGPRQVETLMSELPNSNRLMYVLANTDTTYSFETNMYDFPSVSVPVSCCSDRYNNFESLPGNQFDKVLYSLSLKISNAISRISITMKSESLPYYISLLEVMLSHAPEDLNELRLGVFLNINTILSSIFEQFSTYHSPSATENSLLWKLLDAHTISVCTFAEKLLCNKFDTKSAEERTLKQISTHILDLCCSFRGLHLSNLTNLLHMARFIVVSRTSNDSMLMDSTKSCFTILAKAINQLLGEASEDGRKLILIGRNKSRVFDRDMKYFISRMTVQIQTSQASLRCRATIVDFVETLCGATSLITTLLSHTNIDMIVLLLCLSMTERAIYSTLFDHECPSVDDVLCNEFAAANAIISIASSCGVTEIATKFPFTVPLFSAALQNSFTAGYGETPILHLLLGLASSGLYDFSFLIMQQSWPELQNYHDCSSLLANMCSGDFDFADCGSAWWPFVLEFLFHAMLDIQFRIILKKNLKEPISITLPVCPEMLLMSCVNLLTSQPVCSFSECGAPSSLQPSTETELYIIQNTLVMTQNLNTSFSIFSSSLMWDELLPLKQDVLKAVFNRSHQLDSSGSPSEQEFIRNAFVVSEWLSQTDRNKDVYIWLGHVLCAVIGDCDNPAQALQMIPAAAELSGYLFEDRLIAELLSCIDGVRLVARLAQFSTPIRVLLRTISRTWFLGFIPISVIVTFTRAVVRNNKLCQTCYTKQIAEWLCGSFLPELEKLNSNNYHRSSDIQIVLQCLRRAK